MSGKRERETVMASADILAIVREIRTSLDTAVGSMKSRRAFFEKRYPEFAERFPHLFQMVFDPEFNMERFEYMIRLRNDIQSNRTTFENASKEVGQHMFNEYIAPNLSNANQENDKN